MQQQGKLNFRNLSVLSSRLAFASRVALASSAWCVIAALPAEVVAQTAPTTGTATPAATATPSGPAPTLTSEGISGDVDKKHRGPLVSVGTDYTKGDGTAGSEKARVLVDATIPNDEYKKYPIRFDFYVNRQFFTSQLRSTELPGPIGIEVPAERAKVPFNYSVVATLLHPNREFTTIIHGAIFANELNSTLSSCTVAVPASMVGGENTAGKVTYSASDISVEQTGNESARISFDSSVLSDGTDADEEIQVQSSLSFSGTTVNGSVVTTVNGNSTTSDVTGTGAVGSNGLSAVSVANSDSSITLACE